MSYKLTTGWPQHVETGAFVNPETNAEYVAWIAAGNTPLPYEPPPVDRKPIVIAALAEIDAKSIRPLRSGDADYLASLEAQALALRAELATL